MNWETLLERPRICIYADELNYELRKLMPDFIGLSLYKSNRRHIKHNIIKPMPKLPGQSVDIYFSQERMNLFHYQSIGEHITEIYRILKPGGLFRFAIPDYRCNVYFDRSKKDTMNRIIEDTHGHDLQRWYPLWENIRKVLKTSPFKQDHIHYLHYYNKNGESVTKPIDYSKGYVYRTPDHDGRVSNPYRAMSIVVDCYKDKNAKMPKPKIPWSLEAIKKQEQEKQKQKLRQVYQKHHNHNKHQNKKQTTPSLQKNRLGQSLENADMHSALVENEVFPAIKQHKPKSNKPKSNKPKSNKPKSKRSNRRAKLKNSRCSRLDKLKKKYNYILQHGKDPEHKTQIVLEEKKEQKKTKKKNMLHLKAQFEKKRRQTHEKY